MRVAPTRVALLSRPEKAGAPSARSPRRREARRATGWPGLAERLGAESRSARLAGGLGSHLRGDDVGGLRGWWALSRSLGLSPSSRAFFTLMRSLAATGRGWRHPSPTGRRHGAWKESEMARDPGGLLRRSPAGSSNGPEPGGSRRRAMTRLREELQAAPGSQQDTRRRRAGAERQPVGRETAPEGLRALHRLRSRHPRPRRTFAGLPAGRIARDRTPSTAQEKV
jgi:hypothetical protein